MVSAKPDASRAALAEAIASRNELARQLAAARDAYEQAQAKKWEAQGRLAALRKAREEAHAAQATGARFIASIADGEECDLALLDRQTSPADIDALEREIAVWAQTQSECEATVPLREQELVLRNVGVESAVREAIAASGTVAALLDGLAAIHDEFDRRLSTLAYLDLRNAISEADKEAVASALRRSVRDPYHPICAEWKATFEALTLNADAKLPGE